MVLFDFLKTKKKKAESKFVGRHQQRCVVRRFLGEEVPVLELQMASNKDNSERAEIIKKLEKAEKYMESDMFTNRFDAESVNKDMRELIGEGHRMCVFKNDTVLENRCLKIFDDTSKYLEGSLKKEYKIKAEKFAHGIDKVKSLFALETLLNFISLGGLLKDSSDEQRAWIIMNSLFYPNELVKVALALFPPESASNEVEQLKEFASKLLKEKKISNSDLQKINAEIKEGLALGRENY